MVFCNNENNNEMYNGVNSHNPYFNRWFSAMWYVLHQKGHIKIVTILILIDGFLQSKKIRW